MSDEDSDDFSKIEQCGPELALKEYDWSVKPFRGELTLEELEQALAVLAVLDMDEDDEDALLPLVH